MSNGTRSLRDLRRHPALRPLMVARDFVEVARANAHAAVTPAVLRERQRPDFLGIGAQKSGTTWLDAVLRLHPDIGLPARRKEVHFFDYSRWKGLNWYRWHFRGLEDRVKGEITPAYSILPLSTIEAIRVLNPELRSVILLRNPIDRAWSMASMDLFRHRDGPLGIDDVARASAHIRSAKSLERGRYTRILEKWTSVIGTERLFVGYFEEVVETPAELLARLFEFLGVDGSRYDWRSPRLTRKVHSFAREMPDAIRRELLDLYGDELVALHARLQHRCTAQWLASAGLACDSATGGGG